MKPVVVTLGEDEYTIPPLNVGEFERIAEILGSDLPRAKMPFALFRIIVERAYPIIVDVNSMPATPPQIGETVNKVMTAAGMSPEGEATPATGA